MNATTDNRVEAHIFHPLIKIPEMRGMIERRILVNYRCDAGVVARLLPAPFRPKRVNGYAVAGICLIRLRGLRPAFMPAGTGFTSENAAHRIAVEWDEAGATREGVFIPRRDTNSRLNQLAGGRLFPGTHREAEFQIWETRNRFKLELSSEDGAAFVRVLARVSETIPQDSVFSTLDAASRFFLDGSLGWSPRGIPGEFDGLELHCDAWRMEPLVVEHVDSSFFSDETLFPQGTAAFDSAFLMRRIEHQWIGRGRMKCKGGAKA